MKVYIDGRNNFNKNLIREAFEIVENPTDADYFICQDTITLPKYLTDPSKIILIIVEPPLTSYRIMLYKNLDIFHTVLTYIPDTKKSNQFSITTDPDVFPCNPAIDYDIIRPDTKITDRKIYYAGQKSDSFCTVPDMFNSINLYPTRHQIVNELLEKYKDKFVLFGQGWPNMKSNYKKESDWRRGKIREINEFGCDFVLCLDNVMMENHIYEKIFDGFSSDRVALYLGEPNIEKHIPKDCYIDLRPLFNKKTKKVDIDKLLEIVNNISQEEYDKILDNVHKFRKSLDGKHQEVCDERTKLIIDRINGKI